MNSDKVYDFCSRKKEFVESNMVFIDRDKSTGFSLYVTGFFPTLNIVVFALYDNYIEASSVSSEEECFVVIEDYKELYFGSYNSNKNKSGDEDTASDTEDEQTSSDAEDRHRQIYEIEDRENELENATVEALITFLGAKDKKDIIADYGDKVIPGIIEAICVELYETFEISVRRPTFVEDAFLGIEVFSDYPYSYYEDKEDDEDN